MNKLMAANLYRLKRESFFWIGGALLSVLSLGVMLIAYVTLKKNGEELILDEVFFSYDVFIGGIMAVFVSLYVSREYGDGTLRNKLAVGGSRGAVYFSNLLTCIAAGTAISLGYLILGTVVGLPLYGGFQADGGKVGVFVLAGFFTMCSFTSLYTMVGMLSQNKATTAIVNTAGFFLLMIAVSYVNSRLNEPAIYDSYTYLDAAGKMVTDPAEVNPNYVSGALRTVLEFLKDFLPSGQVMQLVNMEAENPLKLAAYSLAALTVSTGAGYFCFRRKDLK